MRISIVAVGLALSVVTCSAAELDRVEALRLLRLSKTTSVSAFFNIGRHCESNQEKSNANLLALVKGGYVSTSARPIPERDFRDAAYAESIFGRGLGARFDWSRIPQECHGEIKRWLNIANSNMATTNLSALKFALVELRVTERGLAAGLKAGENEVPTMTSIPTAVTGIRKVNETEAVVEYDVLIGSTDRAKELGLSTLEPSKGSGSVVMVQYDDGWRIRADK